MPTPLYSPGMSHMCVVVWVSCLCSTVLGHLGVLARTLDPARARRSSSREYHHSPTRAARSRFPLPLQAHHVIRVKINAKPVSSPRLQPLASRHVRHRVALAACLLLVFCSHPPTPLLSFWCPAEASAPAQSSAHNVSFISVFGNIG
jgi:hypothetical protein